MIKISIGFSQQNCIKSTVQTGCTPFIANIDYCGPLQANGQPFPTIYFYGEGEKTGKLSYTYNNPGIYSVTQQIAIKSGTLLDSTFKSFFRAVSTPSISKRITPCKDKSVYLTIDSTSYDYYAITNSINTDKDTIFVKGFIVKSFKTALESEVKFKIVGKYFKADCETSDEITSTLIDVIKPKSIREISEYKLLSLDLESINNIKHTVEWLNNGTKIQTDVFSNSNLVSFSKPITYTDIVLSVEDQCGNKENVLVLPKFSSITDFQNNQNVITDNSPTFVSNTKSYVKLNLPNTINLSSNTDQDIVCGANDCYYITSFENQNGYFFKRKSSGTCGTSFSLTKPILNTLELDNSNPDFTLVKADKATIFNLATINKITYSAITKNEIKIPKSSECQEVIVTNECKQSSDKKTICPLVLTKNNQDLVWNNSLNKLYNLFWVSSSGDTNLLKENLTNTYFLNPKNYVAQKFCIFVKEINSKNISNTLCLEDYPLVFIPELIYKSENVFDLKTKYIKSFNLNVFDINGNLETKIDPNSTQIFLNLKKGTYFYVFEGISENNEKIHLQGSIIVKD